MTTADEDSQRTLAVALKYAPGDSAPKVVAKGRGLIAEEIIARAHRISLFYNGAHARCS